jgi:hypothetical protein
MRSTVEAGLYICRFRRLRCLRADIDSTWRIALSSALNADFPKRLREQPPQIILRLGFSHGLRLGSTAPMTEQKLGFPKPQLTRIHRR